MAEGHGAGTVGIIGALRILVDADTSKAQATLRKLGGPGGLIGTAIGGAVGAASIAMLHMGDTWDHIHDDLRAKTGLVGAAFEDMESTVKDVGAKVSEDLTTVADTLAIIYQRTGEVGPALATAGESIIDLARLTNTEYSKAADNVATIYQAWGVAAKNQVAVNDLFLRAYQATGTSLDTVTTGLAKNGAILRQLGFSIQDATTLLAVLDKAGIDASTMMGSFRRAVTNLIKAGVDPATAIRGLFDAIKQAPDAVTAGSLAIKIFGARGAVMAQLIREGKLDVDALFKTIADGTDTVQQASDANRDFSEGFREMKNRVVGALGPLTEVFAGISEVFGNAIYLLPALTAGIGNALGRVATSPAVKGGAAAIGRSIMAGIQASLLFAEGMAGVLIDGIRGVWGRVARTPAVAAAVAAAGTVAGTVYSAAATVVETLVGGIRGMWAAVAGEGTVVAAVTASGATLGTIFAVAVAGAVALGVPLLVAKALQGPLADMQDNLSKFLGGAGKGSAFSMHAMDNVGKDIAQEGSAQVTEGFSFVGDAYRKAWDALQSMAADYFAQHPVVAPNEIADPIVVAFEKARLAIKAGFGSVKAALQHPPQIRSDQDRLVNMEKRRQQSLGMLRKAREAGDSKSIRYWTSATIKQQTSIDRLFGKVNTSTRGIQRAFDKAGLHVGKKLRVLSETTTYQARRMADGVIAQGQAMNTGLANIDTHTTGVNMINGLTTGIASGLPDLQSVVDEATNIAADNLAPGSPPKKGPLHHIDRWGAGLMDVFIGGFRGHRRKMAGLGAALAGNLLPGAALAAQGGLGPAGAGMVVHHHYHVGTLIADPRGLDELDRRIDRRRRARRRDRWDSGTADSD